MASASAGVSCRVFEKLPEIRAVHVLHDDVVQAAGFAEVVNVDDVWVIELRERAGFAAEARDEVRRERIDRRQDFQGDDAVEVPLARLVDDAHAAAPEHFQDLKLRQLPGHFGGIADVDDIARQSVTGGARRGPGGGFHQARRAEAFGSVRRE